MYKHYIFLASAYNIKSRIAMNFIDLSVEDYKHIYNEITSKCGTDINLSIHYIPTASKSFASVKKHDPFFEDVTEIKSLKEFINLIYKDRELTGLEVAKYIISKYPCTHLKLEKLTYLCYAEYLCENKESLFKDKIYAFRLGPVIKSVYKAYKMDLFKNVEDNKIVYENLANKMPYQSRIMASRNGLNKLISINKTLEKYKDFKARELVKLTHRSNSPWKNSGAGKKAYQVINDETILKYHNYETI